MARRGRRHAGPARARAAHRTRRTRQRNRRHNYHVHHLFRFARRNPHRRRTGQAVVATSLVYQQQSTSIRRKFFTAFFLLFLGVALLFAGGILFKEDASLPLFISGGLSLVMAIITYAIYISQRRNAMANPEAAAAAAAASASTVEAATSPQVGGPNQPPSSVTYVVEQSLPSYEQATTLPSGASLANPYPAYIPDPSLAVSPPESPLSPPLTDEVTQQPSAPPPEEPSAPPPAFNPYYQPGPTHSSNSNNQPAVSQDEEAPPPSYDSVVTNL